MAEKDSTTNVFEAIKEEIENLGRLGDCLRTLARTQEKFEETTLQVTTDQLNSWGLLCNHIALWIPEYLAEVLKPQAAPKGGV